uniref:Reticulocalbin 2 n=2 Tax=Muroidea TaxID=337687 RepID=D6RHL9_MOUSE
MRLGPRPAALGLLLPLLLYAAVAGASKAEELHYPQGEHRADYDREALLGVQTSMSMLNLATKSSKDDCSRS